MVGELSFTSGETEWVAVDVDNQTLRDNQDILRMTKNEISLSLEQRDEESMELVTVTMKGKLRVKGGGSKAKLKFMPITELADHPELCEMLEGDVKASFRDPQTRISPEDDDRQGRL